jgi:amidohydrolase
MVSTSLNPLNIDLSHIRAEIQALQPQLIEWRRRLHQLPELGFKEQITAEFITQKLQEWGIEHQTGIANTGIIAIIKGKRQDTEFIKEPVLAIRADMDALPIQEENEVSLPIAT